MKWPLLTLLLFGPAASAQTRAVVDSIDGFVRSELARQRVPGMSVAVLRGDSMLLARGYGYANVEHHVSATSGARPRFLKSLLSSARSAAFTSMKERVAISSFHVKAGAG
jgi:hypothetical protein